MADKKISMLYTKKGEMVVLYTNKKMKKFCL